MGGIDSALVTALCYERSSLAFPENGRSIPAGQVSRGRPHGSFVAAEARRGKLRFVRTGGTLHFLVAENDSSKFRELKKVEFGDEPIGLFRAESNTNGAACTVETLWSDVEIRAEKLEPMRISVHQAQEAAANPLAAAKAE